MLGITEESLSESDKTNLEFYDLPFGRDETYGVARTCLPPSKLRMECSIQRNERC